MPAANGIAFSGTALTTTEITILSMNREFYYFNLFFLILFVIAALFQSIIFFSDWIPNAQPAFVRHLVISADKYSAGWFTVDAGIFLP